MNWLRRQAADLKHCVSKENTKSRGFFIGVTLAFVVLLLAAIIALIGACIGVTTGMTRIIGFVALPAVLLLIFLTVLALSKNDGY